MKQKELKEYLEYRKSIEEFKQWREQNLDEYKQMMINCLNEKTQEKDID